MVDTEFVKLCYRAILGREAENDAVVAAKVSVGYSPEALIADFINSAEFEDRRGHQAIEPIFEQFFFDPPRRIDVQVADDRRKALFDRLQAQWKALGETEPYWSVLTHDEYRQANLDRQALDAFYETGARHASLIDVCSRRTGAQIGCGVCLELGCGVGRVTKHLAGRFEKVIAVDISPGNLRQARVTAKREGITNIEFLLLTSLDDLSAIGDVDFFYSVITLQHNPPPIQFFILDAVIGKLRPGGGFLFQTQTYHRDYQFDVDAFLKSSVDSMDMHSLPMHEVMGLLSAHQCAVREVMQDFWTGRIGSHTFFGLSRPA